MNFDPPSSSFDPAWWCPNGHAHTIGGTLFGKKSLPENQLIQLKTPDNDFLELNLAERGKDTPIVVLLHGLEGSSSSYYVAELMQDLTQNNYSVVSMNLRGCGPHLNRLPRFYHSGDTADLDFIINWLHETYPERNIMAAGYSLGGNILLKWLGEKQNNADITCAVAVSAPYNLEICSDAISTGFNKIYEQYFLISLKQKLRQKRSIYPDMPHFNGFSLREFDDKVTSALHGFKNVDDYYTRASCAPFVKNISRPTLLIHSKSDPICPFEAIPIQDVRHNPAIKTVFTNSGGHVGFVSHSGNWLNETIIQYMSSESSLK